MKKNTLAKFFGTTRQSINNWEKDNNKYAVAFIEKYLDDDEAKEFMECGIVSKFETNKQALELQSKIYEDVINFTRKKRNLNEENPERKVILKFGQFLEYCQKNNLLVWLRTLKFEDYIEKEVKIDTFIKEEFIKFLEIEIQSKIEIHNYLNAIEFNFLNEIAVYKFYFIKYGMWNFIPTHMDKINLERIEKFEELPHKIKNITGSKQTSYFLTSIWQIMRGMSNAR